MSSVILCSRRQPVRCIAIRFPAHIQSTSGSMLRKRSARYSMKSADGKGASVLRMIESWIGQEAFRTGVSNYLSEFKYDNAEGKDLWRHLDKASSQPVSEIMEVLGQKTGFPNHQFVSRTGEESYSHRKGSSCDLTTVLATIGPSQLHA